jgi:DnaJ-domain-containing protein 1
VNEAYRTLKDPVQRGRHLLELHGVDVAFETNTQMPTDFLMRQLELREELEAATGKKDPSGWTGCAPDFSFEKAAREGDRGRDRREEGLRRRRRAGEEAHVPRPPRRRDRQRLRERSE